MILDWALNCAFCLQGVAVILVVIRIIRGPSLADRILGLDTLTILGIAIIATFATRTGFYLYIDIGIALALVGFLSTVAFARYLLSRAGK